MRCLFLIGSALLIVHCNLAFCGDGPTIARSASRAQSAAAAGLIKRPFTEADSIQMTRLGDMSYTNGATSKGLVAKFSPDGKRFVVILKKGNLEANINEYSLVLFQTAELFQAAKAKTVASLASSSNRPAISSVRWLEDNDTILFLGERPGGRTQLYSLKLRLNELMVLTSHATNMTSFVSTASGEVIVYAARNPVSTYLTETVSRKGLAVTNEDVTDLIRGSFGGDDLNDHSLFVKHLGKDLETKIVLQGRIWSDDDLEMALSPDGSHLLIQTEAVEVSSTWNEYEDQFLKMYTLHPATNGAHTGIWQYELVDTVTGASQVLFDAPIAGSGGGSEMTWSPDSKSVIVSHVYLPLNTEDPTERALRKGHTFLVEFKVPGRQFGKISQDDLRLLNWNPKTGYVVCDVGRSDSLSGKETPKAYFQKSGETWSKVNPPEQTAARPLLDIVLDEGMNAPPHIVAIDSLTGRKSMLMDLNPQFQNLALARVEEITWKGAHGMEVKGGLYWPADYVAGKKYPLILQTHGWDPDRFWVDGPWTTAFAAQALAGKGCFVLQLSDIDWNLVNTPKEVLSAMAAYEGAIDYLDHRGLIDRNRVGMTGFSHTYWYVTYTLTHSKHHFAAADLADGSDYGYFQYLAFSAADPGVADQYEQVNGGPPFGKSLSRWLQEPEFLMDKIETPLRIQALYPVSSLYMWHWYSGLSRLGKPVEMIYIPDGTHVLEKPWDRMISQQGDVDWFCFWLKGEEDPDPAKAEQYKRWRELRSLQSRRASSVSTH